MSMLPIDASWVEYQDILKCCGRGITPSSARSVGSTAICPIHGESRVVSTNVRTRVLVQQKLHAELEADDGCISCSETTEYTCAGSRRKCLHHCNHSWTHDACCWCGGVVNADGNWVEGPIPNREETN